jgi:YlmC/YmxH family sporulation protein
MNHEMAFCELRTKIVVNVIDGKVLGRVCDVVFSRMTSKVLGFVVPGHGGFTLFKRKEDIFIPFECVIKIGVDTILVELKPLHFHGVNPNGMITNKCNY